MRVLVCFRRGGLEVLAGLGRIEGGDGVEGRGGGVGALTLAAGAREVLVAGVRRLVELAG